MTIQRIDPEARLSDAVIHGGTVYLAGQIARDPTADAEAQTRDILAQIDALLAKVGSSKAKLLTATVFMRDLADYDAMNRAWDAWVDPANLPARATVEARLADPRLRVEIIGVAAL